MKLYLLIGAVLTGAGVMLWISALLSSIDALEADLDAARHSIASLEQSAAQARMGRAVADATIARIERDRTELARINDFLLKEGFDNAPTDPAIAAVLERLCRARADCEIPDTRDPRTAD